MRKINIKIIFACLMLTVPRMMASFAINYADMREILQFGHEIVTDAFIAWKITHPNGPDKDDLNVPFIRRMEKELINRVSQISQKIDNFQQDINVHLDTIVTKITNDMTLTGNLNERLRSIDRYVGHINDLYSVFEFYSKTPNSYETFTLEDFAQTCVSARPGAVPDLLKSIHRMLVPSNQDSYSDSVLILLANRMQEAASQICNEDQSLQQLLYNLYTTVTLTEIKGYSMVQFSYNLLRLYKPGTNFTEEMNLVKQQYATRTLETLRAVKTAMAFAPRRVWRCDARVPKLDDTYTKLTGLFQGYIVNEVDLNPDGTCKESCSYYEYTKVHGCYKDQYCSQQRKCNGRVLKCEYIDSDMWICPANKNSDRRYEYIEYENGRVYGQKGTCSRGVTKVDSWWRWLFWHCSYCFCYCDDNNSRSDRYFSLREAVSDVENNKVVTGVRFKKENQVIHIQIKEGELMPGGIINKTSVQWKPIEEFSILNSNVRNGIDYHTLSWEKRGIDLDDLELEENHVLTGLKFRVVGPRLNLEARMATFNFTTGKLIRPTETGFWISHDETSRSELKLIEPDIPINSPILALPDSKSTQYLDFAPSDRKRDAAQNTVPFVDIQPVEPNPPVALSGAGVYHKGRPGSGGYVALSLFTYDIGKHLSVDLPPSTDAVVNTPNEIRAV